MGHEDTKIYDSLSLPAGVGLNPCAYKSFMELTSNKTKKAVYLGMQRFEYAVSEELRVLSYWKSIDAFKTSLEKSKGRPLFTFYDGPPFATGLPHYGHILAGTIKDVVTRYAHMTGHHVERRFGWDCHGLPVEYEIDKRLNIKNREDVLKMGIANYNNECRQIVMRYASEWKTTVERTGRWIDFENDYRTMYPWFMESVWWVFKELMSKGQVYRGFKVMPFSTGCSTPLSNFEAGQNYKDVIDPAVTISFPLVKDENVLLLAWTTTPWTLPSNLALCVNADYEYIKIRDVETGNVYILLEKCLNSVYQDVHKAKFEILERIKGSDLVGLEYVPLFPYFESRKARGNFRVLSDSYVKDDSGTGIVHQAPAFGEDDYRVCLKHGIIDCDEAIPCPITDDGCFTSQVPDFEGQYVKTADKDILRTLKENGRLIRRSQISHSYPFCWRSDTPLIYRAVSSWFVRVSNIAPQLVANNDSTYWVPDFVQEKRFKNWLENARDWAISRNRFWGTPIPLWVSDDFEEIVCVGSIAELKELSGRSDVEDLHRESIDDIRIPSKMGKGELKRIDEVFDCWFESGSMPYAQLHYPFENKKLFEDSFPSDFIAEGLDQTRGWFYTLMILSTHLFNKPPFKNVIVNGLVLAEDGKKMSKSLQNYPDPNLVIESYGADALRLYLINSPVVRAEPLRFKESGVNAVVRDVMKPWSNVLNFFLTQADVLKVESGIDFKYDSTAISENIMDQWILASLQSLIQFFKQEMEAFRLFTVVPRLVSFIQDLTNWYVRLNRRRLKGDQGSEEMLASLNTLYEVLLTLCKTMAPFTPFVTESMYQVLMKLYPVPLESSVHFLLIPEPRSELMNAVIERQVNRMQTVVELGRTIREAKTISLKTPLSGLNVFAPTQEHADDLNAMKYYILDELNCRELQVSMKEEEFGVQYKGIPNFKVLGTRLRKDLATVKKTLEGFTSAEWKNFIASREVTVAGHVLTFEDIQVTRVANSSNKNIEILFEKDFIVALNIQVDESLKQEGIAREIINRVQKMRKKANLVQTDVVDMMFNLTFDPQNELKAVFASQQSVFERLLKRGITEFDNSKELILQEEFELEGSRVVLTLAAC